MKNNDPTELTLFKTAKYNGINVILTDLMEMLTEKIILPVPNPEMSKYLFGDRLHIVVITERGTLNIEFSQSDNNWALESASGQFDNIDFDLTSNLGYFLYAKLKDVTLPFKTINWELYTDGSGEVILDGFSYKNSAYRDKVGLNYYSTTFGGGGQQSGSYLISKYNETFLVSDIVSILKSEILQLFENNDSSPDNFFTYTFDVDRKEIIKDKFGKTKSRYSTVSA